MFISTPFSSVFFCLILPRNRQVGLPRVFLTEQNFPPFFCSLKRSLRGQLTNFSQWTIINFLMNQLVENRRSKDFAQVSWWLSCYECNRDMVITKVVKSSWLPAKIVPTWLVSAGYSAWHFSTDGVFLNKISLDWPLTLTTQSSTSKLSDNSDYIHSFTFREYK